MDRIRSMYDIGNDGVMELRVNTYYQVLDVCQSSQKVKIMNELNIPLWYSLAFFEN